jgi:membrane-associated phospholipid phosphatase
LETAIKKPSTTTVPFKIAMTRSHQIAITLCFALFFAWTKAEGQFLNARTLELSPDWGKMSLSNNMRPSEVQAGSVLMLRNPSAAGSRSGCEKLSLFGNLGANILNSFKGDNVYLHLTAVAATALIVTTGTDYQVEHYFNEHADYGQWAKPILYTGELLPFAAGGGLLAYAEIADDNEALGASFAVLQASLIEFLYNSALKAVTGRPNPAWWNNQDMEGLSKTFRFGFLRGGMFWGWPSGHTAATMAVVSALTNYYPDATWLKIVGYSWVAYTMYGVSSVNRGGMHWFSDAVAGALMSYAIGSTVGKYYRRVFDSQGSVSAIQAGDFTSQEGIPLATITFEF